MGPEDEGASNRPSASKILQKFFKGQERSSWNHLLISIENYQINMTRNIARAQLRYINSASIRLRRSQGFLNDVRKQLAFLRFYNEEVYKSKKKFPHTKWLMQLLVRYVALEYEVWMFLGGRKDTEMDVKNRMLYLLYLMLNDPKESRTKPSNKTNFTILKIVLTAKQEYKVSDDFCNNLVRHILDSAGLLKEVENIYKQKNTLASNIWFNRRLNPMVNVEEYGTDSDDSDIASGDESSFTIAETNSAVRDLKIAEKTVFGDNYNKPFKKQKDLKEERVELCVYEEETVPVQIKPDLDKSVEPNNKPPIKIEFPTNKVPSFHIKSENNSQSDVILLDDSEDETPNENTRKQSEIQLKGEDELLFGDNDDVVIIDDEDDVLDKFNDERSKHEDRKNLVLNKGKRNRMVNGDCFVVESDSDDDVQIAEVHPMLKQENPVQSSKKKCDQSTTTFEKCVTKSSVEKFEEKSHQTVDLPRFSPGLSSGRSLGAIPKRISQQNPVDTLKKNSAIEDNNKHKSSNMFPVFRSEEGNSSKSSGAKIERLAEVLNEDNVASRLFDADVSSVKESIVIDSEKMEQNVKSVESKGKSFGKTLQERVVCRKIEDLISSNAPLNIPESSKNKDMICEQTISEDIYEVLSSEESITENILDVNKESRTKGFVKDLNVTSSAEKKLDEFPTKLLSKQEKEIEELIELQDNSKTSENISDSQEKKKDGIEDLLLGINQKEVAEEVQEDLTHVKHKDCVDIEKEILEEIYVEETAIKTKPNATSKRKFVDRSKSIDKLPIEDLEETIKPSESTSNSLSEPIQVTTETTSVSCSVITEVSSSVITEVTSSVITEVSSSAITKVSCQTTGDSSTPTTERVFSVTTEGASSVTTEGASIVTTKRASSATTEVVSSLSTEGASNLTIKGASTLTTEGAFIVTTEGTSSLTTEGASSLTTEGASSLTTEGASGVTIEGASSLTNERISSVTTKGASSLTTEGASSLSTEGASGVTIEGASSLTTERASSVTTEGASSLTTEGASSLTTEGASGITIEGASSLTTERASCVTTEGASSLTDEGASSLTTEGAFSATNERASSLTTGGASGVTTEEASGVTTERASSLTTEGASSVTTEGASTLTTEGASGVTIEGASSLTTEGASSLTTEGASTLTTEGSSGVITEGASSVSIEEVSSVTTEGASSVTTEVSLNSIETKSDELDDKLTEILPESSNRSLIESKTDEPIIDQEKTIEETNIEICMENKKAVENKIIVQEKEDTVVEVSQEDRDKTVGVLEGKDNVAMEEILKEEETEVTEEMVEDKSEGCQMESEELSQEVVQVEEGKIVEVMGNEEKAVEEIAQVEEVKTEEVLQHDEKIIEEIVEGKTEGNVQNEDYVEMEMKSELFQNEEKIEEVQVQGDKTAENMSNEEKSIEDIAQIEECRTVEIMYDEKPLDSIVQVGEEIVQNDEDKVEKVVQMEGSKAEKVLQNEEDVIEKVIQMEDSKTEEIEKNEEVHIGKALDATVQVIEEIVQNEEDKIENVLQMEESKTGEIVQNEEVQIGTAFNAVVQVNEEIVQNEEDKIENVLQMEESKTEEIVQNEEVPTGKAFDAVVQVNEEIVQNVEDKIENVLQMEGSKTEEIVQNEEVQIGTAFDAVVHMNEEIVQNEEDKIENVLQMEGSKTEEIVQNEEVQIGTAFDAVVHINEEIVQNDEDKIEKVVQIEESKTEKIEKIEEVQIGKALDAIVQVNEEIVQNEKDKIENVLQIEGSKTEEIVQNDEVQIEESKKVETIQNERENIQGVVQMEENQIEGISQDKIDEVLKIEEGKNEDVQKVEEKTEEAVQVAESITEEALQVKESKTKEIVQSDEEKVGEILHNEDNIEEVVQKEKTENIVQNEEPESNVQMEESKTDLIQQKESNKESFENVLDHLNVSKENFMSALSMEMKVHENNKEVKKIEDKIATECKSEQITFFEGIVQSKKVEESSSKEDKIKTNLEDSESSKVEEKLQKEDNKRKKENAVKEKVVKELKTRGRGRRMKEDNEMEESKVVQKMNIKEKKIAKTLEVKKRGRKTNQTKKIEENIIYEKDILHNSKNILEIVPVSINENNEILPIECNEGFEVKLPENLEILPIKERKKKKDKNVEVLPGDRLGDFQVKIPENLEIVPIKEKRKKKEKIVPVSISEETETLQVECLENFDVKIPENLEIFPINEKKIKMELRQQRRPEDDFVPANVETTKTNSNITQNNKKLKTTKKLKINQKNKKSQNLEVYNIPLPPGPEPNLQYPPSKKLLDNKKSAKRVPEKAYNNLEDAYEEISEDELDYDSIANSSGEIKEETSSLDILATAATQEYVNLKLSEKVPLQKKGKGQAKSPRKPRKKKDKNIDMTNKRVTRSCAKIQPPIPVKVLSEMKQFSEAINEDSSDSYEGKLIIPDEKSEDDDQESVLITIPESEDINFPILEEVEELVNTPPPVKELPKVKPTNKPVKKLCDLAIQPEPIPDVETVCKNLEQESKKTTDYRIDVILGNPSDEPDEDKCPLKTKAALKSFNKFEAFVKLEKMNLETVKSGNNFLLKSSKVNLQGKRKKKVSDSVKKVTETKKTKTANSKNVTEIAELSNEPLPKEESKTFEEIPFIPENVLKSDPVVHNTNNLQNIVEEIPHASETILKKSELVENIEDNLKSHNKVLDFTPLAESTIMDTSISSSEGEVIKETIEETIECLAESTGIDQNLEDISSGELKPDETDIIEETITEDTVIKAPLVEVMVAETKSVEDAKKIELIIEDTTKIEVVIEDTKKSDLVADDSKKIKLVTEDAKKIELVTEDNTAVQLPHLENVLADTIEVKTQVAELSQEESKETVSSDVLNVQVLSEESSSADLGKVSCEEIFTEVVVREELVPDKVVTEEVVTEEVVTEKVVTDKVVTEGVVTEEAVREKVVTEVVTKEMIAEEVSGVQEEPIIEQEELIHAVECDREIVVKLVDELLSKLASEEIAKDALIEENVKFVSKSTTIYPIADNLEEKLETEEIEQKTSVCTVETSPACTDLPMEEENVLIQSETTVPVISSKEEDILQSSEEVIVEETSLVTEEIPEEISPEIATTVEVSTVQLETALTSSTAVEELAVVEVVIEEKAVTTTVAIEDRKSEQSEKLVKEIKKSSSRRHNRRLESRSSVESDPETKKSKIKKEDAKALPIKENVDKVEGNKKVKQGKETEESRNSKKELNEKKDESVVEKEKLMKDRDERRSKESESKKVDSKKSKSMDVKKKSKEDCVDDSKLIKADKKKEKCEEKSASKVVEKDKVQNKESRESKSKESEKCDRRRDVKAAKETKVREETKQNDDVKTKEGALKITQSSKSDNRSRSVEAVIKKDSKYKEESRSKHSKRSSESESRSKSVELEKLKSKTRDRSISIEKKKSRERSLSIDRDAKKSDKTKSSSKEKTSGDGREMETKSKTETKSSKHRDNSKGSKEERRSSRGKSKEVEKKGNEEKVKDIQTRSKSKIGEDNKDCVKEDTKANSHESKKEEVKLVDKIKSENKKDESKARKIKTGESKSYLEDKKKTVEDIGNASVKEMHNKVDVNEEPKTKSLESKKEEVKEKRKSCENKKEETKTDKSKLDDKKKKTVEDIDTEGKVKDIQTRSRSKVREDVTEPSLVCKKEIKGLEKRKSCENKKEEHKEKKLKSDALKSHLESKKRKSDEDIGKDMQSRSRSKVEDTKEGVKEDTKEGLKEDTKESVKEDTKESVKEDTKEKSDGRKKEMKMLDKKKIDENKKEENKVDKHTKAEEIKSNLGIKKKKGDENIDNEEKVKDIHARPRPEVAEENKECVKEDINERSHERKKEGVKMLEKKKTDENKKDRKMKTEIKSNLDDRKKTDQKDHLKIPDDMNRRSDEKKKDLEIKKRKLDEGGSKDPKKKGADKKLEQKVEEDGKLEKQKKQITEDACQKKKIVEDNKPKFEVLEEKVENKRRVIFEQTSKKVEVKEEQIVKKVESEKKLEEKIQESIKMEKQMKQFIEDDCKEKKIVEANEMVKPEVTEKIQNEEGAEKNMGNKSRERQSLKKIEKSIEENEKKVEAKMKLEEKIEEGIKIEKQKKRLLEDACKKKKIEEDKEMVKPGVIEEDKNEEHLGKKVENKNIEYLDPKKVEKRKVESVLCNEAVKKNVSNEGKRSKKIEILADYKFTAGEITKTIKLDINVPKNIPEKAQIPQTKSAESIKSPKFRSFDVENLLSPRSKSSSSFTISNIIETKTPEQLNEEDSKKIETRLASFDNANASLSNSEVQAEEQNMYAGKSSLVEVAREEKMEKVVVAKTTKAEKRKAPSDEANEVIKRMRKVPIIDINKFQESVQRDIMAYSIQIEAQKGKVKRENKVREKRKSINEIIRSLHKADHVENKETDCDKVDNEEENTVDAVLEKEDEKVEVKENLEEVLVEEMVVEETKGMGEDQFVENEIIEESPVLQISAIEEVSNSNIEELNEIRKSEVASEKLLAESKQLAQLSKNIAKPISNDKTSPGDAKTNPFVTPEVVKEVPQLLVVTEIPKTVAAPTNISIQSSSSLPNIIAGTSSTKKLLMEIPRTPILETKIEPKPSIAKMISDDFNDDDEEIPSVTFQIQNIVDAAEETSEEDLTKIPNVIVEHIPQYVNAVPTTSDIILQTKLTNTLPLVSTEVLEAFINTEQVPSNIIPVSIAMESVLPVSSASLDIINKVDAQLLTSTVAMCGQLNTPSASFVSDLHVASPNEGEQSDKTFGGIDVDETPLCEKVKACGFIQVGNSTVKQTSVGGPFMNEQKTNENIMKVQVIERLDDSPVDENDIFPLSGQVMIDTNLPSVDIPIDNDLLIVPDASEDMFVPTICKEETIEHEDDHTCSASNSPLDVFNNDVDKRKDEFNAPFMSVEKMNEFFEFSLADISQERAVSPKNEKVEEPKINNVNYGKDLIKLTANKEPRFPLANFAFDDIEGIKFSEQVNWPHNTEPPKLQEMKPLILNGSVVVPELLTPTKTNPTKIEVQAPDVSPEKTEPQISPEKDEKLKESKPKSKTSPRIGKVHLVSLQKLKSESIKTESEPSYAVRRSYDRTRVSAPKKKSPKITSPKIASPKSPDVPKVPAEPPKTIKKNDISSILEISSKPVEAKETRFLPDFKIQNLDPKGKAKKKPTFVRTITPDAATCQKRRLEDAEDPEEKHKKLKEDTKKRPVFNSEDIKGDPFDQLLKQNVNDIPKPAPLNYIPPDTETGRKRLHSGSEDRLEERPHCSSNASPRLDYHHKHPNQHADRELTYEERYQRNRSPAPSNSRSARRPSEYHSKPQQRPPFDPSIGHVHFKDAPPTFRKRHPEPYKAPPPRTSRVAYPVPPSSEKNKPPQRYYEESRPHFSGRDGRAGHPETSYKENTQEERSRRFMEEGPSGSRDYGPSRGSGRSSRTHRTENKSDGGRHNHRESLLQFPLTNLRLGNPRLSANNWSDNDTAWLEPVNKLLPPPTVLFGNPSESSRTNEDSRN